MSLWTCTRMSLFFLIVSFMVVLVLRPGRPSVPTPPWTMLRWGVGPVLSALTLLIRLSGRRPPWAHLAIFAKTRCWLTGRELGRLRKVKTPTLGRGLNCLTCLILGTPTWGRAPILAPEQLRLIMTELTNTAPRLGSMPGLVQGICLFPQ